VSTVKAAIRNELMTGNKVPGWKLVYGKANRKLNDPNDCIAELVEAGIDESACKTEPEIKSPAQLEKLGVGRPQRKLVKGIVSKYAYKPEGKITIALESDDREAIDPGAAIGAEFDDGEEFEV
jgi:hypothetical protein